MSRAHFPATAIPRYRCVGPMRRINVGLALVWMALGFVVVREYRRLSEMEESRG